MSVCVPTCLCMNTVILIFLELVTWFLAMSCSNAVRFCFILLSHNIFAVTCYDLTLTNGRALFTQKVNGVYAAGSFIIFECDSGYIPIGQRLSKCDDNGNWIPVQPICTGQKNVIKIFLYCAFFC